MRALRERPRVTLARLLGALVLAVGGLGIGLLVAGDGPDVPPETAAALSRAERSAAGSWELVVEQQAELERLRARVRRIERRARSLDRANRRLHRSLARTRTKLAETSP